MISTRSPYAGAGPVHETFNRNGPRRGRSASSNVSTFSRNRTAGERDEAPAGRRTVTITGRPDGPAAARRPARTLDERIMHRPERIASWTCSLGALSILLAIVTAQ